MRALWVQLFLTGMCHGLVQAQMVPAQEENIPYLVTFGNQAATACGDDDFCQVFFFSIPAEFRTPFYLRVFDPDCSGQFDEEHNGFNTSTRYSVFGGLNCITHVDARKVNPDGNFKSGNMLASKVFGNTPQYDGQWYSFGPFNPGQGELASEWGGRIFKMICEGTLGDDGNLYQYFLSTHRDRNVPVEGGNAFTFEYSFRLHTDPTQTSHLFPFVDDRMISLIQSNFDWDHDGFIKVQSVATSGENLTTSGDDIWTQSVYQIKDSERGKSLDIQFTKNAKYPVPNNNVVFYIINQYGELQPLYTAPIGSASPTEQKERHISPPGR